MSVEQILQQRSTAWTLKEVLEQLKTNPHEPCLQYFALVLATRTETCQEDLSTVNQILGQIVSANTQANTTDLLSIFGGAAAVQESLQLEAMAPQLVTTQVQAYGDQITRERFSSVFSRGRPSSGRAEGVVPVDELHGPTVESHPWHEMLGGRQPVLSRLSKLVPADFFLVESRSVSKIVEAFSAAASCQDYILTQVSKTAVDQGVIERTRKQLLLDDELLQFLEGEPVSEVCLAGSDLYLADGSDVSILISAPSETVHQLFRGLDRQIVRIEEKPACDYFEYRGVDCVAITTTDRRISLYAANPLGNVHLRSSSRTALERILDAIGDDMSPRLGETEEFAYVRTLMPRTEDGREEDVFVYFSDAFIRNLVGPQIRIAQRRRKICHNYQKMIESAVLLYSAQEGRRPWTLDELRQHCLTLDEHHMKCPDGGTYAIAQHSGEPLPHSVCSFHGRSTQLRPCIEIPVTTVSPDEADAYRAFVDAYNQYWRMYFDPIGIRVSMKNREYLAETVVLPLIDNSIYTGLAAALQGATEKFNDSPAHPNTIFSTGVKLTKQSLASADGYVALFGGVNNELTRPISQLLAEGIGNQVSFNVCDAQPTFSLDIPFLMGMATAFSVRSGGDRAFGLPFQIAVLVASLQLPVYVACHAGNPDVVDRCLADIGAALRQKRSFTDLVQHSQVHPRADRMVHMFTTSFGPVKFRVFVERIADALYIASQPQVLDEIACGKGSYAPGAHHEDSKTDAHAVVVIEPSNWDKMRAEACLSWRESNRQACHRNLGYLTAFARALHAVDSSDGQVVQAGDLIAAVRANGGRMCPEHGIYIFNSSTMQVECNVHGSFDRPSQCGHTIKDDEVIALFDVERVQAALAFIEDGLHGTFSLRLRPS